MCGIAGLIDYKNRSSRSILEAMTRSMEHRGPDGEGYYWDQNATATVGLGHRRLSIIDLSAHAAQPMHYKNLHLTFNGEIYNYQEIKTVLEQTGHQFRTSSDTEVILHAYEEWGPAMIHRFVGMFAFVIYDSGNQQLIAFRDRAGVKPFYYYHHEGLWLFASELKAFHAHPVFKKKLNRGAVASFLQYGNVPAPHCIFEHAAKLLPGHYLVFDIQKKELKTQSYWSVYDCYNRPRIHIDFREALEETERIFQKAFDYRMVADVPVGVFLSGGYDSTCVTALLQKNRTEKIKTFTIGTGDNQTDEAPFARQIAAHLGTDHTEYYCTHEEAREIIPNLPLYYDEPFADSSAIPTMLVSRLARERVTVALSADGGDEIFAGYTKYPYLLKLQKQLAGLPRAARGLGHQLMKAFPVQVFPVLGSNHVLINKYERLTALLKNPGLQHVFASASQLFTRAELDKLIAGDYALLKTLHDESGLQEPYYDPLSYMMAMDYETYLVDDIMQKVDRASMSVSLESREPLLDQHIIEWAGSLPTELKLKNGQSKYILKQIVHRYVPQSIMERPKKGFTIPIASWIKNDFKDMVHHYLGDDFVQSQGLFDKKTVGSLRDGFYQNGKVPVEKIWYLLMFQLWFDQWMNKPGESGRRQVREKEFVQQ